VLFGLGDRSRSHNRRWWDLRHACWVDADLGAAEGA
jgi:hypothetical protein